MRKAPDGLSEYLQMLSPLIGDIRTERTTRGIIEGIMASGSLRMNQIALFSPYIQGAERGLETGTATGGRRDGKTVGADRGATGGGIAGGGCRAAGGSR